MTTVSEKEKVIQAVRELPGDAKIEDAMERLYLLYKTEKGLQQVESGETIPHAKVKEHLQKWLK